MSKEMRQRNGSSRSISIWKILIYEAIVIKISIIHLRFYCSLRRTLSLVEILCLTLAYRLSLLPEQFRSISPFTFLNTLSILLAVYLPHMLSLQPSVLSYQSIDHTLVIGIFLSTSFSTWFSLKLTLYIFSVFALNTGSTKIILKLTIFDWSIEL